MAIDAKPRVLVVDDEADITSVIKRGLENTGFNVDTFNDPYQALSHFNPDYYDLMLVDIRMPKLNGFQLYREIRKKDGKAKVCFMTAFEVSQEEFSKMFLSYDVACFIKKPVRITDLQSMLKAQLKNK